MCNTNAKYDSNAFYFSVDFFLFSSNNSAINKLPLLSNALDYKVPQFYPNFMAQNIRS